MASFIVAKQPPRVCKRNTRIQSVIIRLLVGKGINLQSIPIDIKASLIDEHQLMSLLQNPDFKLPQIPSRPMSNHVQCLKGDKEDTTRWSANFKNICIQRNPNGMQEYRSLFDAKYWFCFETTFVISDLEFSIWALSHPIVLISNGNQICHALATITWDNCVTSGDVYVAPALENVVEAPWPKLAVELNKQWRSVTGCDLTEDHLNYLETKVSGVDQSVVVTKKKFCMYKLGDTNNTFWEWFFHVIRLVKSDKSLVSFAKGDMLHGWISRARSETLLANSSNPGTFITRFSESNIGKIIITFVHTDKSILHTILDYQPHIKSFANVLRECTFLTHVYPMTPLRPSLDRILEPLDMSTNTGRGYVKPLMRYVIPGITDSLADETHVPVHDAFSVDELGNVELDKLLDEIGTLEPENFIEIENLFPMENSLPLPDSRNEVVSQADNIIYTNLDKSTLEFRTSDGCSELCSSSSLLEEAIPDTDMDLQSATDSSKEFSASGNGVKSSIKQKRWQKPDGFIIHKRKRDQAKYKQKKALQQRAKDITKTCGSRVFLMVEDKILCDSLDGGQDVAAIPEYVSDQFRHRTPVVIPEKVVTRLRNMQIGNINPCSAPNSGIVKKKTRRCSKITTKKLNSQKS